MNSVNIQQLKMPRLISHIGASQCLPRYRLWRQALLIAIVANLFIQVGFEWGHPYWCFFSCLLINVVGLDEAINSRDKAYGEWLVQHFKNIRKHQYKMVEQYEEARNDIANAKIICKKSELESLLSYPHEHTKECVKNCLLIYGDISLVFGENRVSTLPPRFARKAKKGRPGNDIDVTSDEDEEAAGAKSDKANKKPHEEPQEEAHDMAYNEVHNETNNGGNEEAHEEAEEHREDCSNDKHRTESGECRGSETQSGFGGTSTPELSEGKFNKPKIKGPSPQKKKPRKKW